jgi:hypothetical protein
MAPKEEAPLPGRATLPTPPPRARVQTPPPRGPLPEPPPRPAQPTPLARSAQPTPIARPTPSAADLRREAAAARARQSLPRTPRKTDPIPTGVPAPATPAPPAEDAPPGDPDLTMGVSLLKAFDFRLARAAFERAQGRDGKNPRLRALLQVTDGREREVAGDLEGAQKSFEAALATDPSCPEAREAIAQLEEKRTKPRRGFFRRLFFED